MFRSYRFWGTLLALVLAAGCRTAPARPSPKAAPATEPVRRLPADAPLDRVAEAHAHYAAGVLHEMNQEPDEALKEFYQAALRDPDNESLVLEVAKRFQQTKDYDKALELLTRAAARPNASGAVYATLGFIYSQLGKPEQAAAASRLAIKKAPGSLSGYQNLFLTYLQNKQPQEALKVLDEAAKQRQTSAEYLLGLAELYSNLGLQTPSMRKTTDAQAVALLNRVEGLSPKNPALRLKLAEDYNLAGNSLKAAQLYLEFLKQMPDIPELRQRVRARLTEIYLKNSDNEHATQQLEAILADDPTNAQAYYTLAGLALEAKQLDKAAEYLHKAIVINPGFAPAYYDLARVQLALKKTSDALATLDTAREKFPQTFAQEYWTAVALGQQKAWADAIKHYTAAEVIAKATDAKLLDQVFYFELGAAYERNGDYPQAEKNFEQCLKMAPDFAEALNYLGYMWAERGTNLTRARQMIEQALKLEPKNAAYLDSMGWVLFKMERPGEALDYILKAVETSEEPDATLFDHLGDVYAALRQADKARGAWQKSLAVEPNDQIKKKVDELKP